MLSGKIYPQRPSVLCGELITFHLFAIQIRFARFFLHPNFRIPLPLYFHLTSEPLNPEPFLSFTSPNFLCILKPIINPATKLVIPAAAERRAGHAVKL